MTPSPSIDDHHRQLRRFSPDGAHACGATPARPATAPSTLTADLATSGSHHHPTPCSSAKRSRMPLQSRTPNPNLTAKDAMRRTKAALAFLCSPSSLRDVRETCKWIMQLLVRQPRLSSTVHWS
jgi:hypothetical protein